jgi:ribosomal protein S18 acetylase RimI-like enzyme
MTFRDATAADFTFLREMLFEAVYWPPERIRPATVDEGLAPPELDHILAGWGRPGDLALLAEADGRPVGAVWRRSWDDRENSYGYVDAATPVVGIAIAPGWRGRGIGRELLTRLITRSRTEGYSRLSLSVEKENPSRFLYLSCGFVTTSEDKDDYIMVKELR